MIATLERPATRGSTFIGSEAGRYTAGSSFDGVGHGTPKAVVANATGRVVMTQIYNGVKPHTSPIRTGPPDIIRTTRGLGRI